jgi:hypothetical protein
MHARDLARKRNPVVEGGRLIGAVPLDALLDRALRR